MPSDATVDRIHFIINNVSPANVEEKVAQMRDMLPEEYYDWFAQYLVVKRASIEPNFHSLYILVLDTFKSPLLGASPRQTL